MHQYSSDYPYHNPHISPHPSWQNPYDYRQQPVQLQGLMGRIHQLE